MRDIAAVVGIKAASLYAHFPDGKEQMLVDGLREIFEQFLAFVLAGIDVDMSAEEQLRSVVAQHTRWQLESEEKASAWDAAADGVGVADVLSSANLKEIHALRAMYHGYVENLVGELCVSETAVERSRAVLALCDQAKRWHVSGGGRYDSTEEVAEFVWELVRELVLVAKR
ncbi:hypothetical protein MCNF_50220 [Mycolicibacterium confluentis]|uniref:TetR family transcriptional regulator n=2 Tax=Mycolicibacterium confluentis TaxID=28047 RepID=A0A7I7Y416_9MYCO|nr:hypothetical protein MCNF_50220 [Mycolicibacterium confluentis]